jgi:hypothetical protein
MGKKSEEGGGQRLERVRPWDSVRDECRAHCLDLPADVMGAPVSLPVVRVLVPWIHHRWLGKAQF